MKTETGKKGDGFVYWLGVGVVFVLVAYLGVGFLVK
jgi:hypothetical protein